MSEDKQSVEVVSGMVRVAFVSVFRPKKQPGDDNDKMKYEVTALIPKGDDAALRPFKQAAWNALVNKFGPDRNKWPGVLRSMDAKTYLSASGKDGWPFRDGDAMAYDGFAGMVAIKCSNERKPIVVDMRRDPIVDEEEVYSGVYGQILANAYAWDNKWGKGVSFSLDGFRKLKDGEPFVRRASADAFTGYDDIEDAAFADDDVPF